MKTKTAILLVAGYAAIAATGLTATAFAAEPKTTAPVFFENGNTLLARCSTDRMACMMFVSGVSDAMGDISQYVEGAKVCMPAHVDRGQITDIAVKYLKDNPATRQYTASSQVALALWDAFPCQQQASSPKVGS